MIDRDSIASAPITTDLSDGIRLFILSPQIAQFSAVPLKLSTEIETPDSLCFLDLRVSKEYRRMGLATKLCRHMATLAIQQNWSRITGSVDSQYSLKIISRLFNESDIDFDHLDPTSYQTVTLPLTLDQAIMSLERAETFELDTEYRQNDIVMNVNLETSTQRTGGSENNKNFNLSKHVDDN